MRSKLIAGLICAAVLPAGAAWGQDKPPAEDKAPAEASAPAETSAPGKGAVVGQPPEGKGQVVFFRPAKIGGMAVSYKVREAGQELGLLSNGHYFVVPTDPGAHAYVVHSEVKDVLNLEVEPGETYYVRAASRSGSWPGARTSRRSARRSSTRSPRS
jgi:hypothetical protein